jgi:hypothetical protein
VTLAVVVAWTLIGMLLCYPLWVPGSTRMTWVMGSYWSWVILVAAFGLMVGVVIALRAPWLPRKLWRGDQTKLAEQDVSTTG